MFMAFLFWELHVNHGWPTIPAVIVVVFVLAPLFGALVERVLMRGLAGAPATTTMIVTVGLMVALMGVALSLWDPQTPRQMPKFFGNSGFVIGGYHATWNDAITMITAIAVAIGLRLLLFRTRIGTAMRAVVDDRNLVSLNGGRPAWISMLAWAIGASTAAMAGILLAPVLSLDVLVLTLLVVNAYAAALVGRLKSLPVTFFGALGLGLLQSYATLLGVKIPGLSSLLAQIQPALPTIILFVVLLLLPEGRLRTARLAGGTSPRVPRLLESVGGAIAFVVVAAIAVQFLPGVQLIHTGEGLALGLIMLSLVLLFGYGGQASLCQMSFVGIGAYAAGAFGDGSLFSVVMAVLIAAPIGALVALPAMRLQGLYLALATLAFAVLMDYLVFPRLFGFNGSKDVTRLHTPFFAFNSDKAYVVLLAVAFGVVGIIVLALRRGRFGRRLSAMRDSPAACTMLGMNIPRTKLAVFTISAALAGFAGALFGGLRQSVGQMDFQMALSLPLLLILTATGVTSVSGALVGGLAFAYLPVILPTDVLGNGGVFMAAGLGAIAISRNPNGAIYRVFERLRELAVWRRPESQVPDTIPEEVARVGAA
jgi:branched-chain amino acid transport system permease protein